MSIILQRRSIRSFSNKLVPDDQIKDIITAGMYAPSAGNQQGWRFIVIKNRILLDSLSKLSPYATPLKKANVAILILGDKNVKFPQNLEQDLSACAENILLEITNQGLGGVWLAISPEKDRIEYVTEVLNFQENEYPFCIIPVGYPEKEILQVNRFDEKKITYIN